MNWSEYPRAPALAGFVPVEEGSARMLVRAGMEACAGRLGLRGDPLADETVVGGRQAHPVVELPDGTRAVVRRYRRGGAVRHVSRATYFRGHRAFEELLATERAGAGGVRVPEVLAATERRGRVGYAAWLATRWIGGAAESAAWMAAAGAEERRAMLREAGRQVARMHAAGVAHPDLNLRNLLVAGPVEDEIEPAVYVIDFDRARLFQGPVPAARRAGDLRRLARSVAKLRAPVETEGWAALRDGYGADWPFPGPMP